MDPARVAKVDDLGLRMKELFPQGHGVDARGSRAAGRGRAGGGRSLVVAVVVRDAAGRDRFLGFFRLFGGARRCRLGCLLLQLLLLTLGQSGPLLLWASFLLGSDGGDGSEGQQQEGRWRRRRNLGCRRRRRRRCRFLFSSFFFFTSTEEAPLERTAQPRSSASPPPAA